jgi:predicted acylesterase/phospholipase RssA
MIDAISISGGGMRGLSLLGSLAALQHTHMLEQCKVFSGTSVGSIAAALVALDYNIEDIVMKKMIPFVFESNYNILALDSNCGVDTGEGLKKWIITLFPKPLTFKEIYKIYGHILIICATNVDVGKPTYFSYKTYPDMDFRRALVASCSVPFLFRSPLIDSCRYTDGGLTDNFPIEICSEFISKKKKPSIIIGLKLSRQHKTTTKELGFNQYIANIMDILVDSYPYNRPIEIRRKDNTIYGVIHLDLPEQWTMKDGTTITSLIVNPINFKLEKNIRYELFRFGKEFTLYDIDLRKKMM